MTEHLRYERVVRAPPEEVFDAFTSTSRTRSIGSSDSSAARSLALTLS